MDDVVLDLISAGAVSRALSAAGYAKDAKIGRQRRPFEELLRTGGFRASQDLPWRVEIWQRQSDEQARVQTYAAMAETLTGHGYHIEASGQPARAGALNITRLRPPTPTEWDALEQLAGSPLILTAPQVRDAHTAGAGSIAADVLAAMNRSGLTEVRRSFPMLRDPESDTQPEHGSVLSLSDAGVALLIRRNRARAARAMWAFIAPGHKESEPPPLLAGDIGRPRPEPMEA